VLHDVQAEVRRYDAFARAITADGVITDPWLDGVPRFREEPIVLEAAAWSAMTRAAEELASVYNELGQIVADDPTLLESFFMMTPLQRAMWACSQPLWHGIARADLFLTRDGIAMAELNCDTPTGEAEAVVLGRIARAARPELEDPNAALEASFCAMLRELGRRELAHPRGNGDIETIGIVYPTEFTEDLSVIRLYKRWAETVATRVVLGSPYNLELTDDGLTLFDVPIDLVLRHYKTDWWGERASAWDDEVLSDEEPLSGPLGAVLECCVERRVSVVNPFGSVLAQNKRAMAFMWERIHRFSTRSQSVIQRHVPVTSRFESMHKEQLRAQKDAWVLKSDYGAEGEEVVVGRFTTDETWQASLDHARKGHWIAQRNFEPMGEGGAVTNFGVYVIAGSAAGVYARTQVGPTDDRALSVPVLVRS
jgi:glutathionylspermidine synthase